MAEPKHDELGRFKRVGCEPGTVFWRLTYLGPSDKKAKSNNFYHRFRCDCGKEVLVQLSNVRIGNTKSCGCLRATGSWKRNYKHGKSDTPEYHTWHYMRMRCEDPGRKYHHGRGISVCERWDSFENFLADMGPKPSPKHSIDRIDVNGNYEPDNCRWATPKEQARNKRRLRLVTAFGKTQCVAAWCEERGIARATVYSRLARGITDPEKIFAVHS